MTQPFFNIRPIAFVITLLTALSLLSTTTSAQTEPESEPKPGLNEAHINDMKTLLGPRTESQQAAVAAEAAWFRSLFEFITASGDDYSLAAILAKQLGSFKTNQLMAKIQQDQDTSDALNDTSFQPLADALNLLIAQTELSPEALDVMTALCMDEHLKDHCHANVLLEKRMRTDGFNLHAYWRPFDVARQSNNTVLQGRLLELMTLANRSHSFHYIKPTLINLIDQFMTTNPFPELATNHLMATYRQMSGLSDEKKQQLEQLMPAYLPSYVKWSFNYINDVPPYKSLIDYCQTNDQQIEACNKVADTLINASNNIMDKGMGYTLKIATAEQSGNPQDLKKAQQAHDQFKTSYQCLVELTRNEHHMDDFFNPTYRQINLEPIGEFEKLKKLAALRYQQRQAAGDKNAVDPASCL